MRGYLVDPFNQSITEVNTSYPEYKTLIDCEYITTMNVIMYTESDTHQADTLFLDDEALLKVDPGPVWEVMGYPSKLCGRGILFGVDYEGNDIEPLLSRHAFTAMVKFRPDLEFSHMENIEPTKEGDFTIIGTRSIFKQKTPTAE